MREYWIWLQLILGPAHPFAGEVLHRGYDVRRLYEDRRTDGRIPPNVRRKACETDLAAAETVLRRCRELDVRIITPDEEAYPNRLYTLSAPPLVLYCKGTLPCLDALPCLTLVGPRQVSDYGYKCAYSLAARLSLTGFVIISGGAMGSDYAAHDGALNHGGLTVAVLGNGFGASYLLQNESLRQRIEQTGCLLTELPPDTPAGRHTFPPRNRLMAALGLGTIVVEAPAKSGTLITAEYACEQGRQLFVIPGRPGDPRYEGSNALLRDGAKPLLDLSDIINEYVLEYASRLDIEKGCNAKLVPPVRNERAGRLSKTAEKGTKPEKKVENVSVPTEKIKKDEKSLPESLSKTAKMLYNQLDKDVFACDELAFNGLTGAQVAAALGELEIFGLIEHLPGGRFALVSIS